MKIAFISTMCGAPWGGSEELWYRTALLGLREGHQVIINIKNWKIQSTQIIILKKEGAIITTRNSIFRKHPFKWVKKIKYKLNLQPSLSEFKSVIKFKPDILIISQGGTFDIAFNKTYTLLIKKLAIPYFIISQHNHETGNIQDYNNAKQIEVITNAKKFYFVSERNLITAERQLAYHFTNAAIINNPVTLEEVKIIPFSSDGALRMACVARLDCSFKGQDILIQTLSLEKWQTRNFNLKIYGAGPHHSYLERLIKFYKLQHKVTLEGHSKEIKKIWEHNDLLILPSISEGTPLSLMEAMLSGRTALATNVGDISKYIIDGNTGFLAETCSISALSAKLEEVWSKRHELKRMGEHAFTHALKITNINPEKRLLKEITQNGD